MATVDAHDARGRGWVMAELYELGGRRSSQTSWASATGT